MRSRTVLVSLLALGVVLVGCRMMTVPGGEVTPNGTVMFSAEGSAPIVKADDAMALVEARTAAAAIAKANLLEKIKGAVITAHVQVKDLTFASEAAMVNVEGQLARVNIEYLPTERTGPMAMIVTARATLELNADMLREERHHGHGAGMMR